MFLEKTFSALVLNVNVLSCLFWRILDSQQPEFFFVLIWILRLEADVSKHFTFLLSLQIVWDNYVQGIGSKVSFDFTANDFSQKFKACIPQRNS